MRVIYTKGAREDLNAIVSYLERNYPAVIARFEACLEIVIKRIGDWPESTQEIAERPGRPRRAAHSLPLQGLL